MRTSHPHSSSYFRIFLLTLCLCITASIAFVPSCRAHARWLRPCRNVRLSPETLRQMNTTSRKNEILAKQHQFSKPLSPKILSSSFRKRLDTLTFSSSPLRPTNNQDCAKSNQAPVLLATATPTLGFFSHTGLLLVSVIIVNIVKALFFTKPPTEEEEFMMASGEQLSKKAGVMDRCPWPFIFFHDPKQGMRDAPTYVVLCWMVLWRLWKYRAAMSAA